MAYASMDDWLGEVENYSTRAERVPPDAMPWIEAAWNLATKAEQMRCAYVVATTFTEARDTEFDLGFETARKVFAAAIMNNSK